MVLGIESQVINAKGFEIFIGSGLTNDWQLLQNARLSIGHPIFREPTTGGGVVLFTGAADHNISGTLVFSRDQWDNGTANDFKSQLTVTNGEVPANQWQVRFTDINGSAANTLLAFQNCKLSVIDINKSPEGGAKVDITVVCPDEPTS